MDLLIKRKSDGEVFKVWKYVLGSPSQPEEHIWCNDWYGHHVIGVDCEWAESNVIEPDWQDIETLPVSDDDFCTFATFYKGMHITSYTGTFGQAKQFRKYQLAYQYTHWIKLPDPLKIKQQELHEISSLVELKIGDIVKMQFAHRYRREFGWDEFTQSDYTVTGIYPGYILLTNCEHKHESHKLFNVGAKNAKEWVVGKYLTDKTKP